ncbi:hypothetical protein KIPB_006449 [Kipferlia bialata]|uniref:PKD/REJ-like domain-containing protein n=1 Tax=Kipferlia bialata TaxID=797122 RepID=A0A9K3CX96_9EUKA|nr:hypothetical protein KIPB_006449 [Kipferlia bialata]|eukprot:g6449.t1
MITYSPTLPTAASQVTLSGSCVSPTSDRISYHWSQTGGPALDLEDPDVTLSVSTATPNLVLAPSVMANFFEYQFTLACTDTNGLMGEASTSICPLITPSGGYLSVSSYEHVATAPITVSAVGWVAPDSKGPLQMVFTYTELSGTDQTLVKLASSGYATSTDVFLRHGRYAMGVIVTDATGTSTSYTDPSIVTVNMESDMDMDSYSETMISHFGAAVVRSNIPSALNILSVLCHTSLEASYSLPVSTIGMVTNALENASSDMVSLPGCREMATRCLGFLSQMPGVSMLRVATLMSNLMEGACDLPMAESEAVLAVSQTVYAEVHEDMWNVGVNTQSSALTAGLAFSTVYGLVSSIAAGMVEGQRALRAETDHIRISAQALTSQSVSEEVSLPGTDTLFVELPSTFGSELGMEGGLALAMVSVPEPYMGENVTSVHSPMASISVIDTTSGEEVPVSGLSSPVRIRLPISTIPDSDACTALNATLLVKAWNGTNWDQSGIHTHTYDPDLGYILADTEHFTSFVAFFHQYGIDVNVIEVEEIPDLLSSVEDNPIGLYLLGVSFSVYTGLMIVLSFERLQNGMATFFRSQVFKPRREDQRKHTVLDPYVFADTTNREDLEEDYKVQDSEWEFMQDQHSETTGSASTCVSMHSVVFTPLDVPPSPGTLSVTDVDPGEFSDHEDYPPGDLSCDQIPKPPNMPVEHHGTLHRTWTDQPVMLSKVAVATPPHSTAPRAKGIEEAGQFRIHAPDLQELRTERRIKAKMQQIQDGQNVTFWQRFRRKLKEDIYTGHEWTALVFNKTKQDTNMNGPRRVTNIFVFVFGIFLTSAMFFRADCEPGVARPGEEGLLVSEVVCVPYTHSQTFLIACGTSIIAIPPSMLLRFAFSHTRPIGQHKDSALKKRFPPRDRNWLYRAILSLSLVDLPYGFAYVWYGLAFVYLLGVGFMMLLYSMKFARSVGQAWLVANLLGVVQDAVINDPVKIVAQTLLSLTLGSIEILPGIVNLLMDLGMLSTRPAYRQRMTSVPAFIPKLSLYKASPGRTHLLRARTPTPSEVTLTLPDSVEREAGRGGEMSASEVSQGERGDPIEGVSPVPLPLNERESDGESGGEALISGSGLMV